MPVTRAAYPGLGLHACLVSLLFVLGAVSAYGAEESSPASSSAGVGLRLIGVWPGEGVDVFDANGNRIGETLGVGYWPSLSTNAFPVSDSIEGPPLSDSIERTLIFDITSGYENLVFSPEASMRLAGTSEEIGSGSPTVVRTPNGLRLYERLYIYSYQLKSPDGGGQPKSTPFVDVAIPYWQGPRGKAAFTFIGPFVAGRTYAALPPAQGSIAVSVGYTGGGGTRCTLQGQGLSDEWMEVLVYDLAGMRHPVVSGRVSDGSTSFTIWGFAPEDMSAVTIGEEPSQQTFTNIRILPTGMPKREYPEFVDVMCERLKKQKSEMDVMSSDPPFGSDGALRVIDVVRGRFIRDVFKAMQPLGASMVLYVPSECSELAPEDRKRVLDATHRWSQADDPDIRDTGIAMGLTVDFDGFVDKALDELESIPAGELLDSRLLMFDDSSALVAQRKRPLGISQSLAERGEHLKAADVERLKKIILAGAAANSPSALVDCLLRCPLVEAQAALADIARSENTVMWWRALRSEKTLKALGPAAGWPRTVRVRSIIASGFISATVEGDKELADDARRLLPALVTREVEFADTEMFQTIMEELVARCDRETATAALTRFVKSARYSSEEYTVYASVKYVNRLNGVDIAGLGTEAKDWWRNTEPGCMWQVASDAVRWYESRQMYVGLPAGYRAKDRDLRIIVVNKADPDTAAIALWRYDAGLTETGRRHKTTGGKCGIEYEVSVDASGSDSRGILYSIGIGVLTDGQSLGPGVYNLLYWDSELPRVYDEFDKWRLVVEHAVEPKSILSGRKVFEEWWAAHGPIDSGGAGAAPDVESTE